MLEHACGVSTKNKRPSAGTCLDWVCFLPYFLGTHFAFSAVSAVGSIFTASQLCAEQFWVVYIQHTL